MWLRSKRSRQLLAAVTSAGLLVAGCSTREQRIGADDGTDACRPLVVTLDSTGDFFGEEIVRGAMIGAVGGALLGGVAAALASQGGQNRGRDLAMGAGIGALAGGALGAAGGYLRARQQQARDQAQLTAAVASDLQREIEQLDRTQLAFDRLMECRFRQAQQVRMAYRQDQLPRPAAEAQMAQVRSWAQRDVKLAQTINQRVAARGAEFDTALGALSPATKNEYVSGKSAAERRATTVTLRAPVPIRLRPDPGAPEIGQVAARETVQVRPARDGYARVETRDGQSGFVPAASVGAITGSVVSTSAASAATGDIRVLGASSLTKRDEFEQSVTNAANAVAGQGFELAH